MSVEWKEIARTVFRLTVADHWTLVIDDFPCPTRLKIESFGMWPSGASLCGPDGDLTVDPLSVGLTAAAAVSPAPKYPVGALLGKIGGSTAGRVEGKVFAIGRCCIIDVAENAGGPLFAALNADPKTFADDCYFIQIAVSAARP